jgi:hypothetical protein
MKRHAFVTWTETNAPWALEKQLLSSGLRLPLNLDGNPWVEAVAIVQRGQAQGEAARGQTGDRGR